MKNTFRTIGAVLVPLLLLGLSGQAAAQTASNVVCDGCVGTTDIATNGVRRSNIQNFSVNTPKISNFAVTKEKIKTGAVTADKLSDDVQNALVSGDVHYEGSFISLRTEGTVTLVAPNPVVTVNTAACSDWESFRADLRGGNFKTIVFDGSLATAPATCTDPAAADAIAAGLNGGGSSSTVCDGRTWNTGDCGGPGALAVDGSVCGCPDGQIIRPCIDNANWGGNGSATCNGPNQSMTLTFTR